jgi:dUTP pyrophosphatase
MHKIKIKYHDKELPRIEKIVVGDWIDLRVSDKIKIRAKDGEWIENTLWEGATVCYPNNTEMMIGLGISVDLNGMEAHVVPRSSTFKKYGLIQTNSMGIIDSSYNGDGDVWWFPCYSLKPGTIKHGDRICQFRIMEPMKETYIIEVDTLDNEDRGGFGSTDIMD